MIKVIVLILSFFGLYLDASENDPVMLKDASTLLILPSLKTLALQKVISKLDITQIDCIDYLKQLVANPALLNLEICEPFKQELTTQYAHIFENINNAPQLLLCNEKESRFIHHGKFVHHIDELPYRTGVLTRLDILTGKRLVIHAPAGASFSQDSLKDILFAKNEVSFFFMDRKSESAMIYRYDTEANEMLPFHLLNEGLSNRPFFISENGKKIIINGPLLRNGFTHIINLDDPSRSRNIQGYFILNSRGEFSSKNNLIFFSQGAGRDVLQSFDIDEDIPQQTILDLPYNKMRDFVMNAENDKIADLTFRNILDIYNTADGSLFKSVQLSQDPKYGYQAASFKHNHLIVKLRSNLGNHYDFTKIDLYAETYSIVARNSLSIIDDGSLHMKKSIDPLFCGLYHSETKRLIRRYPMDDQVPHLAAHGESVIFKKNETKHYESYKYLTYRSITNHASLSELLNLLILEYNFINRDPIDPLIVSTLFLSKSRRLKHILKKRYHHKEQTQLNRFLTFSDNANTRQQNIFNLPLASNGALKKHLFH